MTVPSGTGVAPPRPELPVAVLVRRAREGSLPAYELLVARFEGRLFNFLLRRTGSRDDAADLTQEAFLRAWQRIDHYDARWQFSTWLFTIARRAAATEMRRRARVRGAGGQGTGPGDDAADSDGPERAAEREQGRLLWEMADRVLTPVQRTALWLRYAEDLSIPDIATVLGRTPLLVRVTLFRARRKLAACSAWGVEGRGRAGDLVGETAC